MAKIVKNTKSTNLRRNFVWNLIGSTAYTFLSLFFLIIATHINGINDAGLFTFAFSAACVFYVIGIYSGRTFQITDKDKNFSDSDYFYTKITTCIFMLVAAIIFSVSRGYDLAKASILIFLTLFKLAEAFSEFTYAVIQKQERLHQVGKSFLLKAIFGLALFLGVDLLTHDLVLTSAATFLAVLLIILCYDLPCLHRAGFRPKKCSARKVVQLLKRGFFAFGFTFLNFYVIQAAKFAIDFQSTKFGFDSLSGNDIQTYYGIISMPATVIALFGQYVIQPFLTSLKKAFAENMQNFTKLTLKLCLSVLGFGILCILAAWLLGIPVLQLLYGIELPGCLVPLLLILAGGTANALVLVLSTSLTTMRRTGGQFAVYILTAVLAFAISSPLVADSALLGASLSYLISMLALLLFYIVLTIFYIYRESRARRTLR